MGVWTGSPNSSGKKSAGAGGGGWARTALLLALLGSSWAQNQLPECSLEGLPLVRNVSAMASSDFGRAGLSHISISSKVHHGNLKSEVWLQTFAPGVRTPIHRHDCEEVFVVLKGSGVLYFSPPSGSSPAPASRDAPGLPETLAFGPNSTFIVPPNQVHQIMNPFGSKEDLQLYAIISRPPAEIYMYGSWDEAHDAAQKMFPFLWDQTCQGEP